MAYGIIKVDTVTFTDAGIDKSVSISGLVQNPTFSGNVTVTGIVSGNTIQGQTISGVTVTGTTSTFATGSFVSLTGTTIQGTTASYTSGSFTSLTGVTTSGTTANFVSGVFSTQISGTTVTGTTASFTSGVFTNISGGTHTITSGVFAVGSAASPSISFTSDPDTGVYSPGANQVALSTNGTGRLFVDASGNVGVGTSLPGYKLDIAGIINANATIRASNGTHIGIFGSEAFAGGVVGVGSTSNHPLVLGTNSTERLRITSAGLVGIGTSSPGAQLHLANNTSNSYAQMRFAGSNRGGVIDFYNTSFPVGQLEVDQSGNIAVRSSLGFAQPDVHDVVYINSSGRVGIGTTSPGVALHVDGDIRADGIYGETDTNTSIQFPGSDVITFNEGGSEAARIDSSGRLLVGTSSVRSVGGSNSVQSLHVESTDYKGAAAFISNQDNGGGPVVFLGKSRGTSVGGTTLVSNDDSLGSIIFSGADGTDLNSSGAQIQAFVDGTPGANDMPGRLVFSVTADGASSPTEALWISNNRAITVSDGGNVVLGTTTGTKIGTATTQKLGFYNATPVVQPAAVADATAATVITQLNDLLAKLRTLGIIAT